MSQLPGSSPYAASPATSPIWKCCATFATSSSLCSLPKASAMSQLCPTPPCGADPWCRQARLIPCPLPPCTCLYITLECPCTVPDLDFIACVSFPCPVAVPCWKAFTMVVHRASLLHLLGPRDLAQRDLGVFRCSPGAQRVGELGDAVGQGCWKELERGASGCVLNPQAFCASPSPLGWCLPLAQPPGRQQTQPTPHQPLPWCQCPTKARWEPSMGRRWPKPVPQVSTRAGPRQATASHSLTHSHSALVWFDPATYL